MTHERRATTSYDATALGTVLTVWAHPDDEAYLAGGLLAAVRDAGHRAVCVTATRGEAADPQATAPERAALSAVRTRELEAALDVLGVTEHHWLDLPDGGLAGLDPVGQAGRLSAIVDDVRPDTVVTFGPDGFTGHTDHQAVSHWTDLALERSTYGAGVRLWHAVTQKELVDQELDDKFGIHDLGQPRFCTEDELALRLPLEGAALDRKVDALLSQPSQTADLVGMIGRDRFAAWIATECFAPPLVRR
jgi:LmbE family N-acetylglucosaminyl deacetylase